MEVEKYGLDLKIFVSSPSFYSVEIHLREIVRKNDEPTNRVMQAC